MQDVETRARNLGFTLVAEGPTCWYALLPGETKFRHVEKRDSEDEMNYIGFYHSKQELLEALARILEVNLYNIANLASRS
jgi:hypothetical protein